MTRSQGRHHFSRRAKLTAGVAGLALTAGLAVAISTTGDQGTAQADGADKSLFVDITKVKANVKAPKPQGDATTGTFTVDCGRNENGHFNPDNFIAAPGVQNGAEHLHDYVGNLTTDANSSNNSLEGGGTTCKNGDESAYFWPVIRIDKGQAEAAAAAGNAAAGNAAADAAAADPAAAVAAADKALAAAKKKGDKNAIKKAEADKAAADKAAADAAAADAAAADAAAAGGNNAAADAAAADVAAADKALAAAKKKGDKNAIKKAEADKAAADKAAADAAAGAGNAAAGNAAADKAAADKAAADAKKAAAAKNKGQAANKKAAAQGTGKDQVLTGNDGDVQQPQVAELTFRGSPVGDVVAMPKFLKILYGDAKRSINGDKNTKASWTCTGFEDKVLLTKYPICPNGSSVKRIHDFPSCWDGKNTDSANHRDHILFPDANGNCKKGFKAVPQLRVSLTYNIPADVQQAAQYKVDSFPDEKHDPQTDHDDFANVMSDAIMTRLVDCINSNKTCKE
jgi:hypothetical protein